MIVINSSPSIGSGPFRGSEELMSKLLAAMGCNRSLELFGETLAGGGP